MLTAFHVKLTLEALKIHDVVLGPTVDGGYCLIGLKRLHRELFMSITWGTETTFKETLVKAKKKGLRVKCLEPLCDVDVPKDLPVWSNVANQFLSVVIPTLNEEGQIQTTLEKIGQIPHGEIIIVDGGSKDRTVEIAGSMGAKVIHSMPNRGVLMNAGASEAVGDILLFLHADTLLPDNFSSLIRHVMLDPSVVGGSFAWKVQPATLFLKYIGETVTWRTKLFGLPYGDQAIFVRASIFRQVGGYADHPLMEDVEFIRRLNKAGKLAFIPIPVMTSPRRYYRLGVFLTTLMNKLIFFGYILGISPDLLVRMYYRKR